MKHINPATEEVTVIEETKLREIPKIVKSAKESQKIWAKSDLKERIEAIKPLIRIMEHNKERIARTITRDMGKPLRQSHREVERSLAHIKFFLDKAPKFLRPNKYSRKEYVVYDSLGIIAVISPWNYPLATPIISIIPALLTGNSVILKQSEYSPRVGQLLEEFFFELVKVPEGVFSLVTGGKKHGKKLVNQDIDLVSFTGSTATGKMIMKDSSNNLHKLIFELGGLDAAIVLKDADIPAAAKEIVGMNALNTGQVCCAIKRVFVARDIYDQFVKYAVEESKKIKFGDPTTDTDMGPLVSEEQLIKVESFVEDAVKKGAKVENGGKRPEDMSGYFYPHTILTGVNDKMKLMHEEPFGPVLPIAAFDKWPEAVKKANDTVYGLTGSVWTANIKLGEKISRLLDVGVAGVNMHAAGSLGTPWGGTKQSGFGRLESKEGLLAFTNPKLITK